jgi:hypothetical protein
MRAPAFAIAMVLIAALAACSRASKPDLPGGVIVKPQVVTVTREVYVDVPAELTDPLPIAEGPLSQCPMVAAERKAQLERANADRKAVRALSGTRVEP